VKRQAAAAKSGSDSTSHSPAATLNVGTEMLKECPSEPTVSVMPADRPTGPADDEPDAPSAPVLPKPSPTPPPTGNGYNYLISLGLKPSSNRAKNDHVAGYGYRLYEPKTGRWISRDPLGDESFLQNEISKLGQSGTDSHEKALMLRGESIKNIYRFVSNDVMNNWDYLGLLGNDTPPHFLDPYDRSGMGLGTDQESINRLLAVASKLNNKKASNGEACYSVVIAFKALTFREVISAVRSYDCSFIMSHGHPDGLVKLNGGWYDHGAISEIALRSGNNLRFEACFIPPNKSTCPAGGLVTAAASYLQNELDKDVCPCTKDIFVGSGPR